MKVVSLWSGGKDSCFACYRAREAGHDIFSIVNFADEEGTASVSHGLSAGIIRDQARMTGIALLQRAMPGQNYTDAFKAFMKDLKTGHGVEGIVFGDIYLQEHRDWIDKVCGELKMEPILPIWTTDTEKLARQIVGSGFKAIVVSLNKDIFGEEWLGRQIDEKFLDDIKNINGADLCGERGEFHTFVYDGPLFINPVEYITGKRRLKDKRWFLEILPKTVYA